MGVGEDTEPPLKRAKTDVSGNSSLRGCSVNNSVTSHGDEETIGSKGLVKKLEFIKIITRALYSLGYDKTAAMLEEESGISLHIPIMKLFLQQIKDGKSAESVETLGIMGLPDVKDANSASFLLLEQKFFDFLKTGKTVEALGTLSEMLPFCTNTKRLQELAFCMIPSSSSDEERVNSRSKVLEELENFIPSSVIIPQKRLEYLVENAIQSQLDSCVYHNVLDSKISLYSDHHCGTHQIPSQTVQILELHTDEVLFLQFSHNGKYLASSSRDQTAIIWEVNADGHISIKRRLSGHRGAVTAILWSPDDRQVITCGAKGLISRWDVDSGCCCRKYENPGMTIFSCGWCHDGKGIIAEMSDGHFFMWHLDGRKMGGWKVEKTHELTHTGLESDGLWLVSIATDSKVYLSDREAKSVKLIHEESFSDSNGNEYFLVNLVAKYYLRDIEYSLELVPRYEGCFGGYKQAFIASGSGDSQVYIWKRSTGEFILVLSGHSGAVNCVSWNPTNLHMLASASDDGTIRIWGLTKPEEEASARKNNTWIV